MNTTSNLINPFLIKQTFTKYTDSSSFSNYQKIARSYYNTYYKLKKKLDSIQGEQLSKKVKAWFFNLSLESRIKICTVENELFCHIIYQMYLRTNIDKSIEFMPRESLTEVCEVNSQNIYENFMDDIAPMEFNLDNFFNSKSDVYTTYLNGYNLMENSIYEGDEREKNYNSNIIHFITNDIKFYSVHHKPFPDCFCFSPYFLLNKEKFDTTFTFFGNTCYFRNLIKPFYNQEKNIYGYFLPDWFNNLTFFSIIKYVFAFIEQAIMIKYILNNNFTNKKNGNKSNTNELIISLINDEDLNQSFTNRKTVINYFNINYNEIKTKKNLLNETNIEKIFDKILNDNIINNKIIFYKNFERNSSYNCSRTAMLIQPLLDINNNNNYIYNPYYDDMRMFLVNNQKEQNNYVLQKLRNDLIQIIEQNDNIIFTDYLLYQNVVKLWEYEYFVNFEIIEHFIKIFSEQNYKDLLEVETTTKKKKKKKKKKKQDVNEDEKNINKINIENNNDNGNQNNKPVNIELECYKELFKNEEEKILYAPYYLSIYFDLKKKFKNIKDNKLKSIQKKIKKQDVKEVYNFIKNEIILKYILNKVIHLQPDNYVNFFSGKKINYIQPKENNYLQIKGLKLIKKHKEKSENDPDTINNNFNNENKNEIKEINLNKNKDEDILDELIREIKDSKKNEIKNSNVNTDTNHDSDNDIYGNNTTKIKENDNDDKNITININNNTHNNNKLLNENQDKLDKLIFQPNENKIIRSNSNHSRKNGSQKKKTRKENMFFLFDTMKTKSKQKNKSKSPDKTVQTNTSDNLNLKIIKMNKESNHILSFDEKLHNNILKNEKKVSIILQYLTKYKNFIIEEIKKIISKTYDNTYINYSLDLYGSFTTGLMIEASDIDIRIKFCDIQKDEFNNYFTSLHQNLISLKKFEKIIPIRTASVPVIKLIIDIEKFVKENEDLLTDFEKFKQQNFFKNFIFDKLELIQIRVDITFIVDYKLINIKDNNINNEILNKTKNDKINNNKNELSIVIYIKEQLELFPEIKPILILLKRYFYIKNMNSSFEGGLSSYNLFLLILSYAKYNNFIQNKIKNLGYFLIQFLEFFGKVFDFKNFTINVNLPYIYEANNFINYNSGKSLTIIDPLTGLNASKSSYKILEIQNMFLSAHNFFEKERILYESEINKNENNDKRNNDKNQQYEGILGLKKIHKNEYSKKNTKDKSNVNIIDKFFFS